MKKITTVLLAMLFLLVFTGTALADDTSASELSGTRYTYISVADASLDIVSGTANMSANLICIPSVDSCNISAYLQRYENGSWVNVQHYSQYSSTYICYWGDSHSAPAGYSYRMKVYFYAWYGGDREIVIKYAY